MHYMLLELLIRWLVIFTPCQHTKTPFSNPLCHVKIPHFDMRLRSMCSSWKHTSKPFIKSHERWVGAPWIAFKKISHFQKTPTFIIGSRWDQGHFVSPASPSLPWKFKAHHPLGTHFNLPLTTKHAHKWDQISPKKPIVMDFWASHVVQCVKTRPSHSSKPMSDGLERRELRLKKSPIFKKLPHFPSDRSGTKGNLLAPLRLAYHKHFKRTTHWQVALIWP